MLIAILVCMIVFFLIQYGLLLVAISMLRISKEEHNKTDKMLYAVIKQIERDNQPHWQLQKHVVIGNGACIAGVTRNN